jgi:hypothetical protein
LPSKNFFANRSSEYGFNSHRIHNSLFSLFLLSAVILGAGMILAHAEVTAVTLQSPGLSQGGTTNLTSPIHVQATAEDLDPITGYVVYVDNQNVYRNFSTTTDGWITLPAGAHTLYVKAWDAHSNLSTATYQINITGFSPPIPPVNALRIFGIDNDQWTVDNNPGVGGRCNTGSLGNFFSA